MKYLAMRTISCFFGDTFIFLMQLHEHGRPLAKKKKEHGRPFVEIRSSLHVLERIACSVKYNEPVLLVGETGTGKTTLVQNLALRLGQKLTVLVCSPSMVSVS